MSLFKATYRYKLKISLILRQVKKTSKTVKKNKEAYTAILKKKGIIIKKYLKDQILKREIKSIYLLKILRVSNLAKS